MIKHIWFDFGETIAVMHSNKHDNLRYQSYAEIVGKDVTPELIAEYEQLYTEHTKSNTAIFTALGLGSDYWSQRIDSVKPEELYVLADPSIPKILEELHQTLPISIFSNIKMGNVLPALGVKLEWFTHILSAGEVKEPKPALDGFYKMIELSELPPDQILYIGDKLEKDILPAKSVGVKTGIIYKTSDEADYSFESFGDIEKLFVK